MNEREDQKKWNSLNNLAYQSSNKEDILKIWVKTSTKQQDLFELTRGAAGGNGKGGQRSLLLWESGIELAPGFFQSVGT